MASGQQLLAKIRASQAGHSHDDLCRLVEYLGFEFKRQARHGALYRHPTLAKHPDAGVRMNHSHILIPKGSTVRPYVARKILKAVDILSASREEGDDEE